MKAPNSKILSITAIIVAFFAIVCSVVNARNYARLVTSPPRSSSLYDHQLNYDPLVVVREMLRTPVYFSGAVKHQQAEVNTQAERSIPRYTVSEENGVVQLEMEVPGVYAKDIEIDLEDSKLLRIKGRRTYKLNDGSVDQSEFDVTFQLKENVDTNQLKANLSAGILRVRVPNKVKEVKRINIGYDVGDEDVVVAKNDNDSDNETTVSSSSSSLDATMTVELVDGIMISGESDA